MNLDQARAISDNPIQRSRADLVLALDFYRRLCERMESHTADMPRRVWGSSVQPGVVDTTWNPPRVEAHRG